MNDRLYVHYERRRIGEISLTATGAMRFTYQKEWLDAESPFPISISLPLDGSFAEVSSHNFFSNLLPEGAVREQICKSLKISTNNDFQLLKAIGGDCAGALTISSSEIAELPKALPRYEPVSEEQLTHWSLGNQDAFSEVTGHNEVRLSLAGAQDKLPVHLDDDRILIPIGNTPSTHILKFASPYYAHLPENEVFISLLAKEVGLSAVETRLVKTKKASAALIKRYDRRWSSGEWGRLHQEDFCQALAIRPSQKYEKEGGPTLKQCAAIIKQYASYPLVDLQRLLNWILFNLFVGNADAHGKNLSLLYDSAHAPTLAPFYDLVCTRNYDKNSREMAMSLGGVWDPDLVNTKHLDRLAADLEFQASLVHEYAQNQIAQVENSLPIAIVKYASQYGSSPVLERLPKTIRKCVRRLKSQLK
jgi:serine/threonine-protein kinase HipA